MPSSRWITLCDEVLDILLGWWEWKILTEDWLDVLSIDNSSISLVEEFEAFEGFSISAGFFESLEPVVGNDVLDECEVNGVTFMEFWVRPLQFIFDITRSHLMKAEVLKNVSEKCIRDRSFIFLVVVAETFFKIVHDITWQRSSIAFGVVSDFGDNKGLTLHL